MTTLADLLAGKTTAPAPVAAPAALPLPNLSLSLMDHQKEAVTFALSRSESYLALDMGLGKTACAIAIAVAEAQAGNTPTLVVVPPSLCINWQREFQKFSPSTSVHIISGTKPYALANASVYIIGDSVLSAWAAPEPTKRTPFDLHGRVKALVVDEAHRHKRDSKRSKALASLAKTVTGRRVLMSGTPIPNGRTTEMAKQLDILGRNAWNAIGGSGYFWSHYAPKGSDGYGRDSVDLAGLGQSMRASFMMRRKREEVLTLPNKGRASVVLEGHGDAVRRYKRIEADLIEYLQSEGKSWEAAARAEAIVRLNLLRKAAGECKVKAIVEHVEDLLDTPGGVFIVAEHIDVMDALGIALMKHGVAAIRGGMSPSAKTAAADAFSSGKARVLIGQITAAGIGLTLHGDGINHRVVIAQLPWTPADLMQSEDRLHRIGQINDVTIDVTLCHIEGKWSIDERLWSLLEKKAFDTSLIIDGEGEFLLEDVQGAILDSYRS